MSLKPAHILTDHPDRYTATIARAGSAFAAVSAGPVAPPDAKYIFSDLDPAANLLAMAQSLRSSRTNRICIPTGTIARRDPLPPKRVPAAALPPVVKAPVQKPAPVPAAVQKPAPVVPAVPIRRIPPAERLCLDTYPKCPERVEDTVVIAAFWGRDAAYLHAVDVAVHNWTRQHGHIKIMVIEAQFDGLGTALSPEALDIIDTHIFVPGTKASEGLFPKELLYNQAGHHAAKNYRYLLFIDLDSSAVDPDHWWKVRCELAHDPTSVVHGFSTMSDDGEPGFQMTGYAFGRAHNIVPHAAPGLLWAMTTREFRRRCGFNPWGIVCSGDVLFVLESGAKIAITHAEWRETILRAWLPPAPMRHVNVPMVHHNHGSHSLRKYRLRDILVGFFGNDPRNLAHITAEGLLEWNESTDGVREILRNLPGCRTDEDLAELVERYAGDYRYPQAKLPDFVISGVMRCGTSAMREILSDHPDIYIPRVREFQLHGWPTDCGSEVRYWNNWRLRGATLADYADLWSDHRGRLCGEHTPGYARSTTALAAMAETMPGTKIVLMLRHPVDRTYSHWWHQHGVFKHEIWRDTPFSDFIDRTADPEVLHWVDECSDYPAMIQRAWAAVGRENVYIGIMERMVADQAGFFSDLLAWLGVDTPLPAASLRTIPGASFADDRPEITTREYRELRKQYSPMIREVRKMLGDKLPEWNAK